MMLFPFFVVGISGTGLRCFDRRVTDEERLLGITLVKSRFFLGSVDICYLG